MFISRELLEGNANVNIRNKQSETPLDMARTIKSPQILGNALHSKATKIQLFNCRFDGRRCSSPGSQSNKLFPTIFRAANQHILFLPGPNVWIFHDLSPFQVLAIDYCHFLHTDLLHLSYGSYSV